MIWALLATLYSVLCALYPCTQGSVYLSRHGSEERMSVVPLHDEENGVVMSMHCFETHGEHLLPENVEYCQSLKDRYYDHDYRTLMNTTFGLVPAGRSPGTYRLAEVMGAGAIPVIVARDMVLPFREQFDWPSFSLWFTPDQVGPDLVATLRAIPPAQLEEMQVGIVIVAVRQVRTKEVHCIASWGNARVLWGFVLQKARIPRRGKCFRSFRRSFWSVWCSARLLINFHHSSISLDFTGYFSSFCGAISANRSRRTEGCSGTTTPSRDQVLLGRSRSSSSRFFFSEFNTGAGVVCGPLYDKVKVFPYAHIASSGAFFESLENGYRDMLFFVLLLYVALVSCDV